MWDQFIQVHAKILWLTKPPRLSAKVLQENRFVIFRNVYIYIHICFNVIFLEKKVCFVFIFISNMPTKLVAPGVRLCYLSSPALTKFKIFSRSIGPISCNQTWHKAILVEGGLRFYDWKTINFKSHKGDYIFFLYFLIIWLKCVYWVKLFLRWAMWPLGLLFMLVV